MPVVTEEMIINQKNKELTTHSAIKEYLAYIKEQEYLIRKSETIKNSLTESLADEVKNIYPLFSDKMMREAWHQQNEKKKADRPMYEFVKNDLLGNFFPDKKKAKLKEIIQQGYTGYAYGFFVDYKGVSFELCIPVTSKADSENVSAMEYGKYKLLYKRDATVWCTVISSYYISEIARAIVEFVDEQNKEEKTNRQ